MDLFLRGAARMPAEVNVEEIADVACHAAFGVIAERLAAAGYPVSGDFAPGEVVQLDRVFAEFVYAMALNNETVAAMNADDEVAS